MITKLALAIIAILLLASPANAQWTRLSGSAVMNVDCSAGSDDTLITAVQRLAGAPFKTLPFATKWMYSNLDLAGNDLTFQIADGECDKGIVMNGFAVGQATRSDIDGKITFRGNTSNQSAVVIRCGPPYVAAALAAIQAWFYIEHLTVRGCYNGRETNWWGSIFFRQVRFEKIQNAQLQASVGGYIEAWGDYTIASSSQIHAAAGTGGIIFLKPVTVAIIGVPNFSLAFAFLSQMGMLTTLASFAGNTTGVKYSITLNSVSSGAGSLPGSIDGGTDSGGHVQ